MSRYFNFWNNLFILFLVCIFILSLAIPAFATEVDDYDIVTDPETGLDILVDNGVSSDAGKASGESDGGESSEGDGIGDSSGSLEPSEEYVESEPDLEPEPSETPVVDVSEDSINAIVDGVNSSQSDTESSEPIKVDITDDSVNAIADAVSAQSSNTITVVNKLGVSYTISYRGLTDVLSDCPYFCLYHGTNSFYYIYFFSEIPTFGLDSYYYSTIADYILSQNLGAPGLTSLFFTDHASLSENYSVNVYSSYFSEGYFRFSNFDIVAGNYLYASDVRVYNISFDTGFEDLVVDSQLHNNFVAPSLSYDGFVFDGWFLDSEFTIPYTVGYEFSTDTTLYAKWIPYRIVSFVTNVEGFELSSVKVLSGDSYYCPAFVYEAYEFIGAFTDPEFTTPFVDGSEITEDTVLYLNFSEIQYDIGGLVSQLLGVAKGLDVIESQLWIILTVGLMWFVYKFFRIFF